MRVGTPETKVSEFASCAGLPVPAAPFAQRSYKITEPSPCAKGGRVLQQCVPGRARNYAEPITRKPADNLAFL